VIELFRGEAIERQVTLQMEIPGELPWVCANREDLNRVFTNLLDNALKYSRSAGKVFIRASTDEDFIRVEIQDTGIGIPQKDLEKIFDEFYRVRNKDTQGITGTGLGLSIAKRILEAHNGHIDAESRLHQGSTFRVLLPILNKIGYGI